MDFIMKLLEFDGCKNIMVTTNYLKKEVIFKSCEHINTETIVNKFIWRIYQHHGPLRVIILD